MYHKFRPHEDADRETETTALMPLHSQRHKHLPLNKQRELLPIFRYKNEILYSLEKFNTLILLGG